jgi:hypothetical protein
MPVVEAAMTGLIHSPTPSVLSTSYLLCVAAMSCDESACSNVRLLGMGRKASGDDSVCSKVWLLRLTCTASHQAAGH